MLSTVLTIKRFKRIKRLKRVLIIVPTFVPCGIVIRKGLRLFCNWRNR